MLTATISDTRDRASDVSGRLLRDALGEAGFTLARHLILRDEPAVIGELVQSASAGNEAEAIVLTGGTGIAARDSTFEAVEQTFEKRIDGFGEAFRRLSWDEMGPHAILSRATAGICNQCVVFSLPGSVNAVSLGVRSLIVPVLEHAVDLALGRARHPSGMYPTTDRK